MGKTIDKWIISIKRRTLFCTGNPDKNLVRNSSKTTSAKKEISPRHLTQLSDSSQRLARNISSMGFPVERVTRIAAKIGDDEKKVHEQ